MLAEINQPQSIESSKNNFKEGPAEALARIKAGDAHGVAYSLKGYEGLNSEVAMALIDAGQGGAVSWYPDKFEGLDHDAVILRLVSGREAEIEAEKQQLLNSGVDPRDSRFRDLTDLRLYKGITQNLHRFQVKPETLDELDKMGFHKTVASYREGKSHRQGLAKDLRLARSIIHLNERT